jgi:hypothetical protein
MTMDDSVKEAGRAAAQEGVEEKRDLSKAFPGVKRVTVTLYTIAHARSGATGSSANIGVIPYTPKGYTFLRGQLTAARVEAFFKPLGVGKVIRYEMPNLCAFNFILPDILAGGGSRSLRVDAHGSALGQALLEMPLEVPEKALESCLRNEGRSRP